jgi:hypothetical protein
MDSRHVSRKMPQEHAKCVDLGRLFFRKENATECDIVKSAISDKFVTDAYLPLSQQMQTIWGNSDASFLLKLLNSLRALFFGPNYDDKSAYAARLGRSLTVEKLIIPDTANTAEYLKLLSESVRNDPTARNLSLQGFFELLQAKHLDVPVEDRMAIIAFSEAGNLNCCRVERPPDGFTLGNFMRGCANGDGEFELLTQIGNKSLEIDLTPSGQAAFVILLGQIPGLFATLSAIDGGPGNETQHVLIGLCCNTLKAPNRDSVAAYAKKCPVTIAVNCTRMGVFFKSTDIEDKVRRAFSPDDVLDREISLENMKKSDAATAALGDSSTTCVLQPQPIPLGINSSQMVILEELPSF